MVFRDCNSNIFNDFKRFFESKICNCVLYGKFCEKNVSLRGAKIANQDRLLFKYLSSLRILGKISCHHGLLNSGLTVECEIWTRDAIEAEQ